MDTASRFKRFWVQLGADEKARIEEMEKDGYLLCEADPEGGVDWTHIEYIIATTKGLSIIGRPDLRAVWPRLWKAFKRLMDLVLKLEHTLADRTADAKFWREEAARFATESRFYKSELVISGRTHGELEAALAKYQQFIGELEIEAQEKAQNGTTTN